ASHVALMGGTQDLIANIMETSTVESVVELLAKHNLLSVYHKLADRASQRAMEYVQHRLKVGTVLLALDGRILGWDRQAEEIGRALGCHELW
ncbi:MAG: cobalamin biosynthesis protein CbiD, partial [Desulfofundulus sp.]